MKKQYLYGTLIFFISLLLTSCLEPFDFKSEGFEKVLVVESIFTDEVKQHEVRLSYTYPLDSGGSVTYANEAEVYIEDEAGNKINFYNELYGIYRTSETTSGQIGNSYKLVINTQEGDSYESSFEPLTKSPPIDSIYDRYIETINQTTSQLENGIQFFLDTHDETGNADFFRFEIEETYKIKAPFPSYYLVENGAIIPRLDFIHECYGYNIPTGTIIGSTLQNTESKLAEQPIRFISENSQFLRTRYSILVKQYAISESAYLYYRKLKENNESSGSLFDKQTGNITGNITSINRPTEPVLGYFEVSGKSEMREFFSPQEFDPMFNTPRFLYTCRLDQAETLEEAEAIEFFSDVTNTHKQIHLIDDPPPGPKTAIIYFRTCTSCDWYADTAIPPYWEEL